MSGELRVSIGQYSDKGRKHINQDFHGALTPTNPLLRSKGIAIVIADGISGSDVSHIAAESTVKSFLTDYYCTPETWSTKTSAHRVLAATNSWLHAQTRRSQHPYDKEKGYVCTVSAVVIRSTTAHIFHAGDSRVCKVSGSELEQLTNDHRMVLSSEQSYLSRALGINHDIEIDYAKSPLDPGDIFVLTTDGIHEFVSPRFVVSAIQANASNLDQAAAIIAGEALKNGSDDNVTIQIVRIDALPLGEAEEIPQLNAGLEPPPLLEARSTLDGYRIIRELHASSRSHLYLATDEASGSLAVLKIPSLAMRDDPNYLRRFMMEEWVARRISNAHVLKPCDMTRKRSYLYVTSEFISGRTLRQWMIDNPKPDIEVVRGIVEQIARGLQAFHRLEMVHQDIRPDNIMIDATGTVRIIDFGSTKIAGVAESSLNRSQNEILGTLQYTAPECFLGESSTWRSDLFSLGVLTYQMLTGKLPYGAAAARAWSRSDQRKLRYDASTAADAGIPDWINAALKQAVHPDPYKRQEALSEFSENLRYPSERITRETPLVERNPLLFWQALSFVLMLAVIGLLYLLSQK